MPLEYSPRMIPGRNVAASFACIVVAVAVDVRVAVVAG